MWKQIYKEIISNVDLNLLQGIGIGIPGPVLEDGFVEVCVNLNLHNFNPKDILKKFFPNVIIKAANDANVAALGEQWKGSGQGYRSLAMVTLGTGVGGAVIIDGKVRYGAHGLSGEMGHIQLNVDEKKICTCGGKGCVDQIASATGIVRYTSEQLIETTEPSVLRTKKFLTAKNIIDAAKKGDIFADTCVRHCMSYLAKSMAAVSYIVDPEAFIIGGGVSNAGDYLIGIIHNYLDSYITLTNKTIPVLKATLGNDAGIYGAARLVSQQEV